MGLYGNDLIDYISDRNISLTLEITINELSNDIIVTEGIDIKEKLKKGFEKIKTAISNFFKMISEKFKALIEKLKKKKTVDTSSVKKEEPDNTTSKEEKQSAEDKKEEETVELIEINMFKYKDIPSVPDLDFDPNSYFHKVMNTPDDYENIMQDLYNKVDDFVDKFTTFDPEDVVTVEKVQIRKTVEEVMKYNKEFIKEDRKRDEILSKSSQLTSKLQKCESEFDSMVKYCENQLTLLSENDKKGIENTKVALKTFSELARCTKIMLEDCYKYTSCLVKLNDFIGDIGVPLSKASADLNI